MEHMQQMQRKIIRQYYIMNSLFVISGMMVAATYVAYLRQKGLNLVQVNLVNTCFFMTLFLFEIPTGAFADIFGRKKAILMACLLRALGSFIYGVSDHMVGFVIAEVTAAIGSTFSNGALQAWAVDSLKHHGYEGSLRPVFARSNLYGQAIGAIGCMASSYITVSHPRVPWFMETAACLITMAVGAIWLTEEYFVHEAFSFAMGFRKMKAVALSSIRYAMHDKAVRFILIVNFVQILTAQPLNMFWQPFFGGLGVPVGWSGVLFTFMVGSTALGALLVMKMKPTGNERRIILWTQIAIGSFVILTALTKSMPLAIALFLLHEFPRGIWPAIKDSYLHERIPSHERATISSFCSMTPHIGGVIGLMASGPIAEFAGIDVAWISAGSLQILCALLLAKNGNGKKKM